MPYWTHVNLDTYFKHFAEVETAESSPLYSALAKGTAKDDWMLDLARAAKPDQPPANMLFGAVHYLLLKQQPDNSLAKFYRSLTEHPTDPQSAYPEFKAFCKDHETALRDILSRNINNSNDVQRNACLVPAFCHLASVAGDKPMHLVEIGASAGFNLLWDSFRYRYGDDVAIGSPHASLVLDCELRGDVKPDLPQRHPPISSRLGIDGHPVDLSNDDMRLWVRSLIWPELSDHAEQLEQAFRIVSATPPPIRKGDILSDLPMVLAALPAGQPVCVYGCHVLHQLPEKKRRMLFETLKMTASIRPVYRISLEAFEAGRYAVDFFRYTRAKAIGARIALCDANGTWLEMLPEPQPIEEEV